MKTIEIIRRWRDFNQSLGNCVVVEETGIPLFASISLERGWRNNQQSVSCIPVGIYKVKLEYSNKFNKLLWEIKDVPNRSETKFHAANYWRSLNGCIALGRRPKDINKDGYIDVTGSRNAMADFHKALSGEQEAVLIIKDSINN